MESLEMFVNHLSVSGNNRLNQILHTLKHVHGFEFDRVNTESLLETQKQFEALKQQIVETGGFNSYHTDPNYSKASLITEAVRMLLEISPRRKKKKTVESTASVKDASMKKLSEKAHGRKPDFLDVDKDGDRKEPMTKALKDKARKVSEANTPDEDEEETVDQFMARGGKITQGPTKIAKGAKFHRPGSGHVGRTSSSQADAPGLRPTSIRKGVRLSEDQSLDQAETLLAAKDISDKLQDMAEDAAKMSVDSLMPLVDTMKSQFGQEQANAFNEVLKQNLQSVLDTVIKAKDETDNAIMALQGGQTPTRTADISQPLPSADMDQEGGEADFENDFAATPAASGPGEEPLGRASKRDVSEARRTKITTAKQTNSGGRIKEADDSAIADLAMMSATGKGKDGKVLTTQQKQAAQKAAEELSKARINEKLTKSMSTAEVISDFVHSDDPKFKGKSKAERTKMALGAYYGMHPEKRKKEESQLARADQLIEHLTAQLNQLSRALHQHKQEFNTKLQEGTQIDPLGLGYGLAGDALKVQIRAVKTQISETQQLKTQIQQAILEAQAQAAEAAIKITKLNTQLGSNPYGVVGIDKDGKKTHKFFESVEQRSIWLEFYNDALTETHLIDPQNITKAQNYLKKRISR
jgi:hypothetical protein